MTAVPPGRIDAARTVAAARFAEVAVGVPVEGTFHYAVPRRLDGRLSVGARVVVPFGRRRANGWVVDLAATLPPGGFSGEVKEIQDLPDDAPPLTPEEMSLYRWIADYYRHPLGATLKAGLPAGVDKARVRIRTERVYTAALPPESLAAARDRLRVKAPAQAAVLDAIVSAGQVTAAELRAMHGGRGADAAAALAKRGVLGIGAVERRRAPRGGSAPLGEHEPSIPPPLTAEQAAALSEIEPAIRAGTFAPFLLHGVTGSGKTEVYLRAIASTLDAGRTGLVLVPEISLTPQLEARFRARFGDRIAVLHSGLSDGQRFDEWRRLANGEASVAIGARSAVFAPLADLGIVVVDEEHDGSYKQEEGLRYHARDVAMVRAQRAGAVAILGSATPSLETYAHGRSGRYRRLVLASRVAARPMPPVERVSLVGSRGKGPLTPRLQELLAETLAEGRQAILLLNRRGFAPSVVCAQCGHVARCRACDVAMILHAPGLAGRRTELPSLFEPAGGPAAAAPGLDPRISWLTCHYCGRREAPRDRCPACGEDAMRLLGVGTQRLERELRDRFPGARLARMDRDTTSRQGAHEEILRRLADGKVDVLLGTQMIAKGLDFPGVGLVGVVLADGALHLADFRAAERTFQLLTQVAGRAGRGDRPGRVVLQTFLPDHYAVAHAATHDYEGFAAREMAVRRELGLPPFTRIVNLRVDGENRGAVEETARSLKERLDRILRGRADGRVVGPAPAPLPFLRGRHRWHVQVRAASGSVARAAAAQAKAEAPAGRAAEAVRVEIDVDPQSLM